MKIHMKITMLLMVILFATLSIQHVAVSQSAGSQTPTLDTVFAKMEKASKDYPYLQGNIEKYVFTEFVNKLRLEGSGKIWISSAGSSTRRVKVEFDKPTKEQMTIDSGAFVDYFPGTKSGKKLTFDKDRQPEAECVLLGLCGSTSLLKQFYTPAVAGQETVNGVKTVLLELRPKDQKREEYFTLIKLWLDANKWYPVQTQVFAKNKNYTLIKYSAFKTGSFSNSVFNLNLPKNAELEVHKF